MKDENRIMKIIKFMPYILVAIVVILAIIILIVSRKDERIKKALLKDNYEEVTTDIYSKAEDIDDSEYGYVYNIKLDEFSKTISTINQEKREILSMSWSQNNVRFNYIVQENGCSITQSGYYNKDNFKCNIEKKSGTCTTKCDIILKEIKKMVKEKQKIAR